MVLTTDTNLYGWEAHLDSRTAQGQWTQEELSHNINFLELRAIYLVLKAFKDVVKGQNILIVTDNVAAKAHVNHLGGTNSWALMQEAKKLGLWAEMHLLSI